jgi:hypothetical protein
MTRAAAHALVFLPQTAGEITHSFPPPLAGEG